MGTAYLLRARHRHDSPLVEIDRGDRTWVRMRFSLLAMMHAYLEIVAPGGEVIRRGGVCPMASMAWGE